MGDLAGFLLFLAGAFVLALGLLWWRSGKALRALWLEPVLRVPVLIFESDDWGAGPIEQAAVLRRLRALLGSYRDARGRHPVMTLGITLAAPHVREGTGASLHYARRFLDHPEQATILGEIRAGIAEGVFAAQLHGMEHFMPELLCEEAAHDTAIRAWLLDGNRYSELLPDRLQSRWIDARRLPSSSHPDALLASAVAAEVDEFTRIFGAPPTVVVPPTFIWTRQVEAAWARHGVRLLVNCGTRFTGRDAEGRPLSDGSRLHNGDDCSGLLSVVRDAYFEPAKGHSGKDVPDMLARYAACGRPLLLETHRNNFTALNPAAERAFSELEQAIQLALARFPTLRFLSTAELGEAILARDPALLDVSFRGKSCAFIQRAVRHASFQRYARFTGAGVLLWLLSLAACRN